MIDVPFHAMESIRPHSGMIDASLVFHVIFVLNESFETSMPVAMAVISYGIIEEIINIVELKYIMLMRLTLVLEAIENKVSFSTFVPSSRAFP